MATLRAPADLCEISVKVFLSCTSTRAHLILLSMVIFAVPFVDETKQREHKAKFSTQLSAALLNTACRWRECVSSYVRVRVCVCALMYILFFKRVRFFVTALFSSIPLHTPRSHVFIGFSYTTVCTYVYVYDINIVFFFFLVVVAPVCS